MKHFILLLSTLLAISACQDKQIEGKWIEIDEYNNPQVYEFKDTQCISRGLGYIDTLIYSIQDTNLVLISKTDTSYKPFYLSGDSLLTIEDHIHLRKAKSDWYLNDMISGIGTNVDLPAANGKQVKLNNCSELYIVGFDENKSIKIWKNGLEVKSDYDLLMAIESTQGSYEDCRTMQTICADINIPYKFISNIKKIFSFSHEYKICYVVKNINDSSYQNTYGLIQKLPSISNKEYAEISYRIKEQMDDYNKSNRSIDRIVHSHAYVETPKLPINKIKSSKRTLIQLFNDSLLRNRQLVKKSVFSSALKESIINDNRRHVLFYYVNDDVSYDNYIKFLELSYKVFNDLRKKMALEKYHKAFEQLHDTIQAEIRNQYPLAILEINKEELKFFE